jgi:hypothetical protein
MNGLEQEMNSEASIERACKKNAIDNSIGHAAHKCGSKEPSQSRYG